MIPKLSKSKYIDGLQCVLKLWLKVYKPELKSEVSPEQQALFDHGNRIGELAKKLYPDGIEITQDHDETELGAKITKKLIEEGIESIFEATALTDEGLHCRIDVLVKVGVDEWDMVEVKSAGSVKEYHIKDMAFQRMVFENAGYKIRKSILMHANGHIEEDETDPDRIFVQKDITKKVKQIRNEIEENCKRLLAVLEGEGPKVRIGRHCSYPFQCEFKEHCNKGCK